MKRLILLSIIAVTTVFTTNAQADSELVQLGARGGLNLATITGDDFESPDSRTSFYVGFVAEVPMSERFSIQPEVYYSGQGFTLQNNGDGIFDTSEDIEYQLDYIQVPVLAKIYLVKGLNIQAGPQIGFKVNEEIDYQPNDDAGDIDISNDASELNDIDFGMAAGVEYKFDGGFFIQGRYNYGFTELVKDYDVHNTFWQAGVGFMF